MSQKAVDEKREDLKSLVEHILTYRSDQGVAFSDATTKELISKLGETEDDIDACKEVVEDNLYKSICSKKIMTLDTLWQLPSLPNDYIIEDLLWKKNSVMWIAKDKVGKSIATMQLACSLTTGNAYLETFDIKEPCKVAYIQTEGTREDSKHRTLSMSKAVGVDTSKFFYIYNIALEMHTSEGAQEVFSILDSGNTDYDVVIVDCLYKAIGIGDVCNNVDMTGFTRTIDQIKEKYNCAVIVVHHKKKSSKSATGMVLDGGDEDFMGSSILKNYFNHTINMREHKDKTRTLRCDTQRNGGVADKITLTLSENPLHFVCKCSKASEGQQNEVLTWMKRRKNTCSKDVCKYVGLESKDSKGRSILSSLYKKKLIKKTGEKGPRGEVYYKGV